jgi:small ligand-binding sensory domain FIST
MERSHSGIGTGNDWRLALDQALAGRHTGTADLAIVFASYHYREDYPAILAAIAGRAPARVTVGCSGQGIIGTGIEAEQTPAISVMSLALPGVELGGSRLEQPMLATVSGPAGWYGLLGREPREVNAWLLLADPFTFDTDALVDALTAVYPGVPVIGGMASGRQGTQGTELFVDGEMLRSGALLLSVGGAWTVKAVVSQGAEPIGETWTVTAAERNLVATLGGRPALQVLIETVRALEPAAQQRASRNLLVGIAMDEYRDEFGRGDFLIRNLVGVDQQSGAIAIGANARVGQTLQFQVRDAAAADDELDAMLMSASLDLHGSSPAGALLCSCNGRGAGLFGEPHHDATAVAKRFGPLPVAGFFCNGEIGPVGGKTFVHGFTASIGFFVPVAASG